MLSASGRCSSETTRTAIGEAMDQNTAWEQATPIREAISAPKLPETVDRIWHTPNKASVQSSSLRISMRQTSSISGSDSSITTHA